MTSATHSLKGLASPPQRLLSQAGLINESTYVVILAGGEGTRFAPLSTPERPKQFLKILSPTLSMIAQTAERLQSWIQPQNLFVSTNQKYSSLVSAELPQISLENIIGEPLKKNTAPAIALVTQLIVNKDPNAVILFLPSDHYIHNSEQALKVWQQGVEFANKHSALVTFGVPPTFASTEYGYLKQGEVIEGSVRRVAQFVEKPNQQKAEDYLASGAYTWNSGQFVWKGQVFLDQVHKHLPSVSHALKNFNASDRSVIARSQSGISDKNILKYFEECESISVDYGVMEKADLVCSLPFDAGWSDVGTWKGLKDLQSRYSLNLSSEVLSYLS